MGTLAPICLFVYKRLTETQKTVASLQANPLAIDSDLIVFSDAARNDGETSEVAKVRDFISSIKGFKSIRIVCQDVNLGLATSIITGVSSIMAVSGKAIVLEDDLVTSKNFLDYMNAALEYYAFNPKVFAVSGYSYPMRTLRNSTFDAAFSARSYSWGWGTWSDRWKLVDWNTQSCYRDYLHTRGVGLSRGGSDLIPMLKKQSQGTIDSWMIRWVYAQCKNGLLDVFPTQSKVQNIGFGGNATHTDCFDARYRTPLDSGEQRIFTFDPNPQLNKTIHRELLWLHSRIRRGIFKLISDIPLLRYAYQLVWG